MRQLLKVAQKGGREADDRRETHNAGAARTIVIQMQQARFHRQPPPEMHLAVAADFTAPGYGAGNISRCGRYW